MNGIDSIIFDLDGTLWDSTASLSELWTEVVNSFEGLENRKITASELMSVMGKTIDEIGKTLFVDLSYELQNKILKACTEKQCDYLKKRGAALYPGIKETIKELSEKYRLFIVSNCQKGYIPAFFEVSGLEAYFEGYMCHEDTNLPKSENIKLLIKEKNLKAVYVGDTQKDADSAESAGVPFVFAEYGFGSVNKYTVKISSLKELKALFK